MNKVSREALIQLGLDNAFHSTFHDVRKVEIDGKETYAVKRSSDGLYVVWGDELKQYRSDIIMMQYTGWKYGTGDFILSAYKPGNQKEIICRWEENEMPEYLKRSIRQALGYEEDDSSVDKEIELMSPREAFSYWLQWEGILGYTDKILSAIEDIYGCNFEERIFEKGDE